MSHLSRFAVYVQANYPRVVGKLIHKVSTKKSSAAATPAAEPTVLTRTNGRHAADVAAGVPGASKP